MVNLELFEQFMDKFDLNFLRVESFDLRYLYPQFRPNDPIDDLFTDSRMTGSPHFEVADLLASKGEKHLRSVFSKTRYAQMLSRFGKKPSPEKVIKLFNSLKKGYLRKQYENCHIVILNKPFALTRYERDDTNIPTDVLEIFSGHHRVGCLLALGHSKADGILAEDGNPGSRYCEGKIHNCCVSHQN